MAVTSTMQAATTAWQPPGKVSRFLLEHLKKSPGERLSLVSVRAVYRNWCRDRFVPALDNGAFVIELQRLVKQIGINAVHEDGAVFFLDVTLDW